MSKQSQKPTPKPPEKDRQHQVSEQAASQNQPEPATLTPEGGGTFPGDIRVSPAAMLNAQEQMVAAMEEKRGPDADEAMEEMLRRVTSERDDLKRLAEKMANDHAAALSAVESELANLKAVLRHEAKSDGRPNEAPLDTLERRLGLLEKFETKLGNELRKWVEESPDNAVPYCLSPSGADGMRKHMLDLEAQLQPAHNLFGPLGNARGLIISHVAGSGPSYDVGGKYRLALVTVKAGEVNVSEAADIEAGTTTHELTFGLVRDHVSKRLEDFLTPEAHRS